jgi:hypothetical protein
MLSSPVASLQWMQDLHVLSIELFAQATKVPNSDHTL